jgi:dihydroorotate dehydrogenase (fumarate)
MVVPNLQLSSSAELRLRLRWVAILHEQVNSDFAVTGGVHSGDDVIKTLLAGSQVAMMASAILKHGIDHIRTVLDSAENWLKTHDHPSVDSIRGRLSQRNVSDPAAFERANYIQVLNSYDKE